MQLRLGAGGHAGPHLALVSVKEVEQGCGVLLPREAQSLRGQRVCDGGQPLPVSFPGGEVPQVGRVIRRAQAQEAARRRNL